MKIFNFIIGISLFFIFLLIPLPFTKPQQGTFAVMILMAYFWIFEVIPIYITALFPLFLFPILKILTPKEASLPYSEPEVYLFLGGFFIAKAMEKHDLHKRISFLFLKIFPKNLKGILMGIMFSVAIISGWMSNTAACIMAFPIVMAILKSFGEENEKVEKAFLLSIAYSASIGGIITPVGTPPNIVFLGQMKELFPDFPEIHFAKWISFGLPVSLFFIFTGWLILYLMFLRKEKVGIIYEKIFEEKNKMGKMKTPEKIVLIIFLMVAFLWLTRRIWENIFNLKGFSHDGVVAVLGAVTLFLLPYKDKKKYKPILDWETAINIPWGVLLIFGGGFSLAFAFQKTGLTEVIAGYLVFLKKVPIFLFVMLVCFFTTFITEVTSNTATATIILPFLASLSKAINVNPLILMIPATLSVSFAFMLPSGTPPNAIVFASGKLKVSDMVKAGIVFNIAGIFIVTFFFFFLIRFILRI